MNAGLLKVQILEGCFHHVILEVGRCVVGQQLDLLKQPKHLPQSRNCTRIRRAEHGYRLLMLAPG